MAEPFSIAAGAVSIIVPAIHATRLLIQDIENIRYAPKTIKNLTEVLKSVQAALSLLQNIDEKEWTLLGEAVAEEAQRTISSCTEGCDTFRNNLTRWTRHSGEGKMNWRDRTKMGLFRQGQIKAISEQMQSCHQTINSVVGIATLYSSVRHSHVTEEIKAAIVARQTEVEKAITTADKAIIVLQSKAEELDEQSEDDDSDDDATAGAEHAKAEAAKQFEEGQEAVRSARKLLEELLAKAQVEEIERAAGNRSGHVYTTTFGDYNSGFQAGVINGGITGFTFGAPARS